ncbi:DUF6879 family protein [Streptomyces sp. NPDC006527]|jgi:hypothetical protein|uniref:DUF6879 family protein n=1 Tax=Streptomyces sp. NPDC006527 TaxID=3364749 RepID=UPI003677B94F
MSAPTNSFRNGPQRPDSDAARQLTLKLLVTVVVGGVVYVLTNVLLPKEEGPWQLVLSVLCGGTVLIVQFMASFVNQLGELKDVVEKRFADIGEATKLFNEVEKLRGDGVPRLAEHATKVVSMGPDILHEFAHEEINRLAGQMEELTKLSAECPGENHDWLINLTKGTRESLDAVSTTVVDDGFWTSEPAGRYLTEQGRAIDERRVTIRRVFIMKEGQDHDSLASLAAVCKEQGERGIEVRVVRQERIARRLGPGTMIDFIVFDRAMSYEIKADQREAISSTTVNANPDRVETLIRRFNTVWDAARKPEDEPALSGLLDDLADGVPVLTNGTDPDAV